ncbi:hypothetical protein HMPREF0058_2040 [Actinomyces urogenitalis DSM 15434]|uniref:Uncharacterized protein n=1 Tax=Actinomyces urogenitalis DSM 15434 TaxID=525246 RepID=C0W846_9ACTO|nr:hypothetical protein HMPREF0058_2040 [Actinomyces urogenitalis DSM 15434]
MEARTRAARTATRHPLGPRSCSVGHFNGFETTAGLEHTLRTAVRRTREG